MKKKDTAEEVVTLGEATVTEKDRLLALYKTLQDLGIRSLSDLENLIAKAA